MKPVQRLQIVFLNLCHEVGIRKNKFRCTYNETVFRINGMKHVHRVGYEYNSKLRTLMSEIIVFNRKTLKIYQMFLVVFTVSYIILYRGRYFTIFVMNSRYLYLLQIGTYINVFSYLK